jgi:transglutaminase-like putative cysteine protease
MISFKMSRSFRRCMKQGRKALILGLLSAALLSAPVFAQVRTPQASGTSVFSNGSAVIDASNASQGYIMVKYSGGTSRIKVRISKGTEYTYDLNTAGNYEVFPLTEGSGSYTVKVFQQVQGTSYAQVMSQTVTANIADSQSPFLYPNQFCNFNENSAVVAKAAELTAGISDPLAKVQAVYRYAVDHISYDYQKAASVQSGYLPIPDATLASGKGICFDYAAVMTSMLRSLDIPTKLVIGYTGGTYHAWVSVYLTGQGWVDNIIYFDGTSWRYMDPTFASSGKGNAAISSYISNQANYQAKFTY